MNNKDLASLFASSNKCSDSTCIDEDSESSSRCWTLFFNGKVMKQNENMRKESGNERKRKRKNDIFLVENIILKELKIILTRRNVLFGSWIIWSEFSPVGIFIFWIFGGYKIWSEWWKWIVDLLYTLIIITLLLYTNKK